MAAKIDQTQAIERVVEVAETLIAHGKLDDKLLEELDTSLRAAEKIQKEKPAEAEVMKLQALLLLTKSCKGALAPNGGIISGNLPAAIPVNCDEKTRASAWEAIDTVGKIMKLHAPDHSQQQNVGNTEGEALPAAVSEVIVVNETTDDNKTRKTDVNPETEKQTKPQRQKGQAVRVDTSPLQVILPGANESYEDFSELDSDSDVQIIPPDEENILKEIKEWIDSHDLENASILMLRGWQDSAPSALRPCIEALLSKERNISEHLNMFESLEEEFFGATEKELTVQNLRVELSARKDPPDVVVAPAVADGDEQASDSDVANDQELEDELEKSAILSALQAAAIILMGTLIGVAGYKFLVE